MENGEIDQLTDQHNSMLQQLASMSVSGRTPSALQACRTYRRYSGGRVCVGCSLPVFPDGAAADDCFAADGLAYVAAFSATATDGQQRGLGQV